MNRPNVSPIDAQPHQVQVCEPRLALSGSMASGILVEALNLGAIGVDHEIDTGVSPDLVEQAAELRATHGLDGAGQTVAVIDSGVAWDHVALGGGYGPGYRVVGGWDFAESDSNPYDDGPAGFHGTHVSGVLAGNTDDYGGVAPAADIVALRVFDDQGLGQLEWIESALQWVHQHQDSFESPITTVNLSVGAALTDANGGQAMSMIEDELAALREDDILVFAASGNLFTDPSAGDGVLYPASSPSVVAVTSVDDTGELSEFAQRENGVLAGRGESVNSAVPDHVYGWDGKVNDYAALDGTSMATPQVAAASMLVRQAMISEGLEPSAEDVLDRIRDAAVEGTDPVTGAMFQTVDLSRAIGESISAATDTTTVDRFEGSNLSEQVVLDLRDGIRLSVDGSTHRLAATDPALPLTIDVGGGFDSLQIIGSESAQRLILHPVTEESRGTFSTLITDGVQIDLRGFENVSFDGGGGRDRATLFDSSESDRLVSRPSETTLSGVGFQFDVTGVSRVYVHATSGGNDTAFLHDGAGDDTLAVRPQFSSLRSDESFQLAYGFERVYAYATAGGHDAAKLYDSAGDDTMNISGTRSSIVGPGYHVSARGFESTEGHADAGGFDVANIYADGSSSRWNATDDMVQWTGGDEAVRVARGFDRTMAFENYQAIELRPQFLTTPWWEEDSKVRADREADAARAVFDQLGE